MMCGGAAHNYHVFPARVEAELLDLSDCVAGCVLGCPPLKLRVLVDDIKALFTVKNKVVAEMAKKVMMVCACTLIYGQCYVHRRLYDAVIPEFWLKFFFGRGGPWAYARAHLRRCCLELLFERWQNEAVAVFCHPYP